MGNPPVLLADDLPFMPDLIKDGYHIYDLNNLLEDSSYYPGHFPRYPGVSLNDLKVGDRVSCRLFFTRGGEVEGGYLVLEVELIEVVSIMAMVLTDLPVEFPISTGESMELFAGEILFRS